VRSNVVLTLTGSDKVGLVEEISRVLLHLGANVETSRMARLGGEFAMLMLVSLSAEQLANLDEALAHWVDSGYKITTTVTDQTRSAAHPDWLAYRIEVQGADHEGIVHEIAAGLARRGISVESAETSVSPAPISGTLLFAMSAIVAVPRELDEAEWLSALADAGRQSNVDVAAVAV